MHQEIIARVAELAPTMAMFHATQLAHSMFWLNACRQFAVRSRFRTLRRSFMPCNAVWYEYVMPNDLWDGPSMDVCNGVVVTRKYYARDRLHGHQALWYPSGRICERHNYVHGVLHGVNILWYEAGHMMEHCQYVDGQRCGVRKYWSESGTLTENYVVST